jgi:AcrR family transcriptional regulator
LPGVVIHEYNLNRFSSVNDAAGAPRHPTKGERTRALIRDAALRSFRERGYEATTVREIARETGVSLGVTNYHFPTKHHLVQELYLEVTREFHAVAVARMAGVGDLVGRLRIAYETGLAVLEPYHEFAPGFLAAAVSPRSPINPLSGESEPALAEAIAVFREAVAGARHRLPEDLAAALPGALTIAYLLLAMYFSYDRSPGLRRTRALLAGGLRLLALALPLARTPGLRGALRDLLELVAEVRA